MRVGNSCALSARYVACRFAGIGHLPAHLQGTDMTSNRIHSLIAGLAVAATLGACSDMTPREHSTAVGAGVGAAAGAVLTGTPQGAVVGGAVGGVVGNQIKR
jgi:osmotically inducible lipoprotein OsmB